jgi:hypothetical protein
LGELAEVQRRDGCKDHGLLNHTRTILRTRTTGFFENEIQRDFKNLSESLTNFRYSPAVRNLEWAAVGTQPTLPPDQKTEIEKQINTINRQIYLLNITLYHFASCFDKKHQTENGCK